MNTSRLRAPGFLLLLILTATPAHSHRIGESYVYLNCEENALKGRVVATAKDLNQAVRLDQNGDGEFSDEELEVGQAALTEYFAQRLAIGDGTRDYPLRFTHMDTLDMKKGRFVRLHFVAEGVTEVPDVIEAEYRGLFDAIPNHLAFLLIESNVKTEEYENESVTSLLFSPDEPRQSLDLTDPLPDRTLLGFVKHGIWHIWIGIDHILFVIALVMTSVLRRTQKGWEPVDGFVPAFINVAKVVTLFTLAHSITLGLAALGLVNVPSRLVESVIALSVFLVAINAIRPFFGEWTWTLVFGFGLFHGFGFASVLANLTETGQALIKTLLAFNIGVELGQLAVILLVFPLLYVIRDKPIYIRFTLPVASAAIAIVAALWFSQRAFEIG